MLIVDDRAGSRVSGSFDFCRHLKRQGVATKVRRLAFGDFALTGHGPTGLVRVGVERKTVDEILSAVMDNRFTGRQVPGLLRSYDVPILVVEGKSWPEPQSGILMNGRYEAGRTKSRHLWANYLKFQFTLAFKARLVVWPTRSKTETVLFLAALHDWFNKRWRDHKSVYTIDETKPEFAILDERTLKRRLAAQIPQVAWVRSKKVDQYFDSILDMFTASALDWQAALGIEKGTALARSITTAIAASDRRRLADAHRERSERDRPARRDGGKRAARVRARNDELA